MNTPSDAVRDTGLESQATAPDISPARRFYWSMKREFWESRSIYLAPLAVAALFLIGFLISTIHLPQKMRAATALGPAEQQALIEEPYNLAVLLLMGTAIVVAVFYSLDALYGERRDRSILFWKSLPVSDVTTVLAKATVPILLLPLLEFAITVVTQAIMLLVSSAVLLGAGVSANPLWTQLSLFSTWPALFYHLVGIHGLWFAPFFGWLLLVSAWARRAPFLWAVLPGFVIAIVERIAFNTAHFANMLQSRISGGADDMVMTAGSSPMQRMLHVDVGHLLASPGLWVGLGITAAFLAAAVQLRRYRGPV